MDDTPTPPPEGSLGPELACAAWFHRGEAEMAMSQVKEAQRCFLEVTRRRPDDARAWCNLGIARAVMAEYEEAVPALMEALRLEPSLVAAMNELAYIHAVKYRSTGRAEAKQAVLVRRPRGDGTPGAGGILGRAIRGVRRARARTGSVRVRVPR